jgi:hypothetical protein
LKLHGFFSELEIRSQSTRQGKVQLLTAGKFVVIYYALFILNFQHSKKAPESPVDFFRTKQFLPTKKYAMHSYLYLQQSR